MDEPLLWAWNRVRHGEEIFTYFVRFRAATNSEKLSDIGMQNAAGRMFHHDKHVEEAKGGCDDDAEVTRHDRLRMIADKGCPAL